MQSSWPDTPASRKIVAELLDGRRIEYRDLKPGDVFRPVRTICDSYLNFQTGQLGDDNFYCRATGVPQANGSLGEGFALEVETGTKEQIVGDAPWSPEQ